MDPQDIRLGVTLAGLLITGSGIVYGVKNSLKNLTSGLNGHVDNKAVHMSVKEKSDIAVVTVKTENNEEIITVLREDLESHESNVRADLQTFRTESREDLQNGLKLIREVVKNGH